MIIKEFLRGENVQPLGFYSVGGKLKSRARDDAKTMGKIIELMVGTGSGLCQVVISCEKSLDHPSANLFT